MLSLFTYCLENKPVSQKKILFMDIQLLFKFNSTTVRHASLIIIFTGGKFGERYFVF